MSYRTKQKFFARFDAPPAANSFTRRVLTARRWLANAKMIEQEPKILKDAAEFAGSSEQDFLAYVAWQIRAFEVKGK